MDILSQIDWLAIILGTIVYSAFSGIWHKQFAFGKKWEEAMGFKRPEGWKETSIYYIVPLISCFTTTVAISILLKVTQVSSITSALKTGALAGVGIAMAVVFTAAVIPIMKKPLLFGAITGTAQALGIILVTVVVFLISK